MSVIGAIFIDGYIESELVHSFNHTEYNNNPFFLAHDFCEPSNHYFQMENQAPLHTPIHETTHGLLTNNCNKHICCVYNEKECLLS